MDREIGSERLRGQEFVDRMKVLSGVKEVINESIIEPPTLLESKKLSDGKSYGILKENSKFFIKVGTGKKTKEELHESDFVYINGEQNKLQYRYNSLAKAQKQLNFIQKSLNETYAFASPAIMQEESIEDEVTEETIEEQVPSIDDEEELLEPEVSDVPIDDAGLEGGGLDAEPEIEVPGEPVSDYDLEDVEGGEELPIDDPVGDLGVEDEFGEFQDDPAKEIQSLTGKLTQKIRQADMTPDMSKSVLNSVIASVDLLEVPEEERIEIARKVKMGGESKKETGMETGFVSGEPEISTSDELELQEDKEIHKDFGKTSKGTQPIGTGRLTAEAVESTNEEVIEEDFGDTSKGTQSPGKGRLGKDKAKFSSIKDKTGKFGKTAKGTQSIGKGRVKSEGEDRIGELVSESLRNINKSRKVVTESKKPLFTSKRSDLKQVENLIEGVLKKKDIVKSKKLKENYSYSDNMNKSSLEEAIAPNEIVPLIDFLMGLGGALGIAGTAMLASDVGNIRTKLVNLFTKLGKRDTASKIQNTDDASIQQAVNQVKQKQGQ